MPAASATRSATSSGAPGARRGAMRARSSAALARARRPDVERAGPCPCEGPGTKLQLVLAVREPTVATIKSGGGGGWLQELLEERRLSRRSTAGRR